MYLDTVTQSKGKIVECAKKNIENNKNDAKLLCRYISDATKHKNAQITKIAISTKDALISYYGYKELKKIGLIKQIRKKTIV